MAKKLEEKIESLIKQPVEKLGYHIYDIIYEKEGKKYYLKVFIEKEKGEITLDDCEKVHNTVNPILDEKDLIKEEYYLVISSTGIERNLRKLEHYQKAIGEEIKIKLFKKNEQGNKEIEGILKEVTQKEITIQKEEKNIIIKMDNISNANILYHWE